MMEANMTGADEPSRGRIVWEPLAATDDSDVRALSVICPFCHAPDAEPLAMFGAQLLTDQYYCPNCHTPFEHIRDQPEPERG
jgi:hypothetical protein